MKKSIFGISIILLFHIHCIAQDLPKTPAETRAQEVIGFLNGENINELDEYINNQYTPGFRDYLPVATHKGLYQSVKTNFNSLQTVDINKSTNNEISLVLKSVIQDACLNLNIMVEPDEPHRVASMGLEPCSCPDTGR